MRCVTSLDREGKRCASHRDEYAVSWLPTVTEIRGDMYFGRGLGGRSVPAMQDPRRMVPLDETDPV